VAFGVFIGLGEHFIMAMAVAMTGGSVKLGVLASLPGILSSLAQLFDHHLVRWMKSRKRVVLVFALAQASILLPLMGLALTNPPGGIWWLVFFASLYSIFGALIGPAWGSIMAQAVPDKLRGSYFSMRSRLSTLANVVTFLLAGLFLNQLVEKELWGFAALFASAAVARFVSWLFLTQLYEPPEPPLALANHRNGQLAASPNGMLKYLLFLFCMSFAVNIAGPYFTLYQLRELGMGYFTFVALEAVSAVATLFAVTHWGHAADRVGNRRILLLTSLLIPFTPLLWIPSSNLFYLAFVQAFGGLAWAGFNLCSVNYLFDATHQENRVRYLSYFNAGMGLTAGIGALLGGYLLHFLPSLHGSPLLLLFLISGLLRLVVSLVFMPQVKEVRKVSKLPAVQLFHVLIGGRPLHRRVVHRRHLQFHLHPRLHKPRLKGTNGRHK
jgi:MFS family permease